MYDELTEEQLIALAIEHVSQGVSLPKDLRTRLDPQVLQDIEAQED